MPTRDWKFRIEDMIEAIEDIFNIAHAVAYEDFCLDNKAVKAVLYNMAIIGEAARHIPEEIQDKHKAIPWREMGDMRNVVIHGYFGVDLGILWDTIQRDLPPLLSQLQEVLAAD